jgi:chemotaxis protein MotA
VVEAAVGINRGVSPMVLEESLKIFLSPKEREKEAEEAEAPAQNKGAEN